ncbi:MAG: hypothetical protein Q9166_004213 [cf. Caloplaca sp. 2 TL-2023]
MALLQHPNLDRQHLPTPAQPTTQQAGRLVDSPSSRLTEVFEFPIHGSCSRCHHLHTNKALHLPLDPQQHTRIQCDYCEHPILGIGRTSTQTTLASIETNVAGHQSWRNEADAASDQDHQPVQLPPLRVDTSGNSGQLSTITEGVSPAQQSTTAPTPPVSGDQRSERTVSHESVPNHQILGDREHESSEHQIIDTKGIAQVDAPSKPSHSFWISHSHRSFWDRIRKYLRKPRSFNINKLGVHVDVSPTPSAPGRSSPLAANSHPPGPPEETIDLPPNTTAIAEPRASITSGTSTPVRSKSVFAHPAERVQHPASAHPDPLIGRTLPLHDKHERIRARRREATLKRHAELISKCECQIECQCRNRSVQSNDASLGPEPSERSIQVPVHHLHRLLSASDDSSINRSSSGISQGSYLVGVGSHLHPQQHVTFTTDVENQQVSSDRLSQTSTVYVRSNGSSVSLSSRGSASLRRSSTTPASLPRRSAEGFRPDLLAVAQNHDIPELYQGAASQATEPSQNRDSDAESLSSSVAGSRNELPG